MRSDCYRTWQTDNLTVFHSFEMIRKGVDRAHRCMYRAFILQKIPAGSPPADPENRSHLLALR
jgi:hypothetical protein